MADIKFTCTNCSQHISCDEAWSGHPIQCPGCQTSITVPAAHPHFNPRVKSATDEPETPIAAKLAAGATKVRRSTGHAPGAQRKYMPRQRAGDNPLVKFAVLAVIIAVAATLFFMFGLPFITSLQRESSPNADPEARTSQSGRAVGGPLGEMNEAMDVSDALDSGSSSRPRPRQAPATTNPAPRRP